MKTDIDTTIVTIHGAIRLKERCKIKNSRSVEKNVSMAFQRGKHAADYTSWEKVFLLNEGHNNCIAIAYNGFCYVFNPNNVCVTLYPLPSWFGKKSISTVRNASANSKSIVGITPHTTNDW